MKKVYVFGKKTCPLCKDTYEKLCYFKEKENFSAEIRYFDMDTVDGLTEGSFYEVSDIPTVVIVDDDQEIVRWTKKPLISQEFLPYLK